MRTDDTSGLTKLLERLDEATQALSARRAAVSPSLLNTPTLYSSDSEDSVGSRTQWRERNISEKRQKRRREVGTTQISNDSFSVSSGSALSGSEPTGIIGLDRVLVAIDNLQEEVSRTRSECARLSKRVAILESTAKERTSSESRRMFPLTVDISSTSDGEPTNIHQSTRRKRKRSTLSREHRKSRKRRELEEARTLARHLMRQLQAANVDNDDEELELSKLRMLELAKAARECRREAEILRIPLVE